MQILRSAPLICRKAKPSTDQFFIEAAANSPTGRHRMSAFGGRADVELIARMSAFDPKRTFLAAISLQGGAVHT
jgi:hypothetical protein